MSLIDELSKLPQDEAVKVLAQQKPEVLEGLLHDWPTFARPEQLPPKSTEDGGPWNTWLYLGGRGTGKTRAGAEWVRMKACGKTPLAPGEVERFAIIGETAKDVRDVLIEGQSGIMSVHPKGFRPVYEPSKARLTWPNGAIATLYNGTEPDQLRGPQFGAALCDELAKWRYAQDAWDMLQFALRLGDHPQVMVTTTPRPIPLLKQIIKNPRTVLTKGSTFDNLENLAPSFIQEMKARYEGTRLGRQELSAEIIDDDPNALWRRSVIEDTRKSRRDMPEMIRIVVAIDPAAKALANQKSEDGAETGIVVAGLGSDGRGYIMDDLSCQGGPNEWGRRAVSGFDMYEADTIIAEINQGGDMVAHVIRSVRQNIGVKQVTASRGKVSRAEPVAALYEQGRISHVGAFPVLEDQMVAFNNLDPAALKIRKDRVDALVWALSDLFPQLVGRKEQEWSDRWTRASGYRPWRRRRA